MALIFVLDDERDACQLMQRVLAAFGHNIHTFTDACEAMEWLTTHSPDLALIDIKLRGADGIKVLEFLRAHQPLAKAIMITGHPSADTATKALELGIEDYLVKPVEIDELEERVNRALGLIL